MWPGLESSRSEAMLDTPCLCCTMWLGRLLKFGGESRARALAALIRSNHLLRPRGAITSAARLPL